MMSQSPHTPQTGHGNHVLCPRCDWVMHVQPLAAGEYALCSRCRYRVAEGAATRSPADAMAWAVSALLLLLLAFGFDFLGFTTGGISHTMTFWDAIQAFQAHGYPGLALLFALTTAILPGLFLLGAIYLGMAARLPHGLPLAVGVARLVRGMQMWMMSDVLLVGILISLIKIVSMATIELGPSFLVFCLFSVLLLKTMNMLDWPRLWQSVAGSSRPPAHLCGGATGRAQHVTACHACAALFDYRTSSRCPRCGQFNWLLRIPRLQLTAALLVTASLLYVPASIYPIMKTSYLFGTSGQTIAGGVLQLIAMGSWPIAVIIFCASIVVPLTKIGVLAWLCLSSRTTRQRNSFAQTRLFRIIELIGRWSMLDVFVVAVLTALVQAGFLMAVSPGPAAVSFAAVVILTMIAAETFDTRLLWPQSRPEHP